MRHHPWRTAESFPVCCSHKPLGAKPRPTGISQRDLHTTLRSVPQANSPFFRSRSPNLYSPARPGSPSWSWARRAACHAPPQCRLPRGAPSASGCRPRQPARQGTVTSVHGTGLHALEFATKRGQERRDAVTAQSAWVRNPALTANHASKPQARPVPVSCCHAGTVYGPPCAHHPAMPPPFPQPSPHLRVARGLAQLEQRAQQLVGLPGEQRPVQQRATPTRRRPPAATPPAPAPAAAPPRRSRPASTCTSPCTTPGTRRAHRGRPRRARVCSSSCSRCRKIGAGSLLCPA